MSTINKSIHRATISLDVPTKIADVLLYANNIVQKLTNNPAFPTPTPTIAALTAASARPRQLPLRRLAWHLGQTPYSSCLCERSKKP